MLRRYEGTSTGSDFTYLCFLADSVAALPFIMNDEALFVIFHLNRIISLRASTLPDLLQTYLALLDDADADGIALSLTDTPPMNLREGVELSLTVSIMLALKRHMKVTYELTDARTRAYSPSESLKPGEGFRYSQEVGPLDLSWVDSSAGASIPGCRRQVQTFCSLVLNDSNDFAEDILVDVKGGWRRRRRPSKAAAASAEASAGAEGGAGDEDTYGWENAGAGTRDTLQTAASTGGPKNNALRTIGTERSDGWPVVNGVSEARVSPTRSDHGGRVGHGRQGSKRKSKVEWGGNVEANDDEDDDDCTSPKTLAL
jgi:hypothetical protein